MLAERVPGVEPYSINEMFLDLSDIAGLDRFCRELRRDVRQRAKLPTCIGVGLSKTLATIANRIAKCNPALGGVCDLQDPAEREKNFVAMPIADVWGDRRPGDCEAGGGGDRDDHGYC